MSSNTLNFSEENLITGINVVEGMLFWTDNRNEPRKINIDLFEAADHSSGTTSIYGRSFQERDITVIRPGPEDPIALTVISDGREPTATITVPSRNDFTGDDISDEILGEGNNIDVPGDTSGLEPTVETLEAIAVSTNSVIIRGASNDNGLPLSSRGFYLGTESNKNSLINNNVPIPASIAGPEFQRMRYFLAAGTRYYFVAFAENSADRVTGDLRNFTTKIPASNGAPNSTNAAVVNTLDATFVNATSARLEGDIDDKGDATITESGFYIGSSSENSEATLAVPANQRLVAMGPENIQDQFEFEETGLTVNTRYNFLAYIVATRGTSSETLYGNILDFTTSPSRVPTVNTTTDSVISEDNAFLRALIVDNGGSAITRCGFIFSSTETTQAALISLRGNAGNDIVGTKTTFDDHFGALIPDLREATRYNYIAYALNSTDYGFSTPADFVTGNVLTIQEGGNRPSVVTTGVFGGASGATQTSLHLGGNIINDGGGGGIEERGFYFGTQNTVAGLVANNDPIIVPITGVLFSGGSTTEVLYSRLVQNLTPNTTYYFFAFASNAVNRGDGDVKQGTTRANADVPTVQALRDPSPGTTTVQLRGRVNASPGSNITEVGFYYNEFTPGQSGRDIANDPGATQVTVVGGGPYTPGVGVDTTFTFNETGLTAGTYYQFTPYAINSSPGFGVVNSPFSFTTLPPADQTSVPVVTTNPWAMPVAGTINIFKGLNGYVDDGGGRAITEVGFYYSTSNPGLDATILQNSGTRVVLTNAFIQQAGFPLTFITYLPTFSNGTRYYFTAFARNGSTIDEEGLGGVQNFLAAGLYNPNDINVFDTTTTVTTGFASNVGQDAATLEGSWTVGVGRIVVRQGYFISSVETTAQGLIDNGFFISAEDNTHISVLDSASGTTIVSSTTYYFMAYVELQGGVEVMGDVESFTTPAPIVDQVSLSRTQIRSSETNATIVVTVAPTDAGWDFTTNTDTLVTRIGCNLILTNIQAGSISVTHGRNSSIARTIMITDFSTSFFARQF